MGQITVKSSHLAHHSLQYLAQLLTGSATHAQGYNLVVKLEPTSSGSVFGRVPASWLGVSATVPGLNPGRVKSSCAYCYVCSYIGYTVSTKVVGGGSDWEMVMKTHRRSRENSVWKCGIPCLLEQINITATMPTFEKKLLTSPRRFVCNIYVTDWLCDKFSMS